MGKDSKISWTDHTFNPWWGCNKIAAGCKNCYAETLANRFGLEWGGQNLRLFGDKHWREPLAWDSKAKAAGVRVRVFCGSMCDVGGLRDGKAGEEMDEARMRLWKLIEATPNLDWLLLTKRPSNLGKLLPWKEPREGVWVGTSVCTQADADKNIPELLRIPAAVRFVSCEPLLEGLDMRFVKMSPDTTCEPLTGVYHVDHPPVSGEHDGGIESVDGGPKLDWIIVGGESGPRARPCRVEWIRSIVRQCREAGVATWVKQIGSRPIMDDAGADMAMVLRDRAGADMEEWPEDLRVREIPKVPS